MEDATVPDERERVAADAVVRGLRDRQHRSCGKRRIDRVAAMFECP